MRILSRLVVALLLAALFRAPLLSAPLLSAPLLPGPRLAWANPALADPGPYAAGWRNVTVARANGETFPAVLFYPARSAAQDAAFDPSGAPYPALSFGHGLLSRASFYQSTLAHLATHGYIVIAADSYTLSPPPELSAYAADLSRALTYLEAQNSAPASPFYRGAAVDRFGVFGHSMGGGASILAAASDPRIRSVANLAAAESTPASVAAAAANLRVPLRLVAGSSDGIAPLAQHQQPIYDSAPPPRQLAVLQNGGHCGFMDSMACDAAAMPRATQLRLTRYLLTGWFDYDLKGDRSLWPEIWGERLDDDPLVIVQREDLTRIPVWLPFVRSGW